MFVSGSLPPSTSLIHQKAEDRANPAPASELFIQKPATAPLRTLSPPSLLPPPPQREGDCSLLPPPFLLPGHPREGQTASLLGGKYLLLEEMEGASLHRCIHIHTNQQFVCKVSSFYCINLSAVSVLDLLLYHG